VSPEDEILDRTRVLNLVAVSQ